MTKRIRKNRGFTLVEILIVVIILGILAAIVIPQFTSASQDARKSSLSSQLQTLRSQVELFKLQHGDALPDLKTDWSPLLATSTYGGKTFGPYLQQTPINSLNNLSVVFDGTGAAAATSDAGWIYDQTGGTGKIVATDTDKRSVYPE